MKHFTLALALAFCCMAFASSPRQLNSASVCQEARESAGLIPNLGILTPKQASSHFSGVKDAALDYQQSLLGLKSASSDNDSQDETELIFDEDFDMMEDGSIDNIDTSLDLSGYVIDFENGVIDPNTDYLISDAFTQEPGWTGACVYQAGGAVALYYPNVGGILNTPNNLNLNGVIRVSFRGRSASEYPCTMVVTPCCHDWANIEMATEHKCFIQTFYPEDGWTDVEFDIDVPYDGDDAFIQFNAMTYSDGVIIDDLKIERVLNKIMEPYSISVSNFTDDGFKLSWLGDVKSDGYILNLWETAFDENGTNETLIDFNDLEWDENLMITEFNLPEGWSIELNENMPQVGTNPLDETPGILFYEDYERYYDDRWLPFIATPQGGRVSEFKCQMTVVAENTVEPPYGGEPYATEWRLYGINDTGNSKLLNLGEVANVLGTTIEFDIANAVDYYGISNDYTDQYYGFELEIWPSNDGCVLVDNISFSSVGSSSDEQVVKDLYTIDTQHIFTGLNMDGEHYFTLQAFKGDYVTTLYERERVFGVRPPVALEASDVDTDNGSFVANWETVKGASGYNISVTQRYEATEYTPDYAIISEDFSKLDDMPYTIDNPYVFSGAYLDDLSQYTYVPGWTVYGGTIAAGMVGCQENYDEIFFVCTPYLDLSHGNGVATIYAKAYGTPGDRLRMQYMDEVADIYFDEEGVADGTATLSNVSSGYIYFYTVSGDAFFLDEVKIMQDLSAGDVVVTRLNEVEIDGADIDSYNFENLYVIPGMQYLYTICSWAYNFDTAETYVSEPSNEIVVQFNNSGIQSVIVPADGYIQINGLTITSQTPYDIFDLQGRILAKQQTQFTVKMPGLYIVKTKDCARKVLVK